MKARLFGTIALLTLPTIAFAADAGSGPTKGATSTNDAGSGQCAEVISCGTKDGKVKEYRTPCDAEKDGATDVHARQGSSCTAEK